VHRAGIRLHLTLAFPQGVARRARALAGAGLLALVAQQVAVLVALWVSQHRGGPGTLNIYTYVQAVYLLPYAVLAVPIATAAFPALASGVNQSALATGVNQSALASGVNQSSVDRAQQTLSSSARAITVATCAGAAVLFAAAPPIGAFFAALDAGRHSPAGQEALAALPAALSAFAPGLVGFGLLALFTRALYARGRPGVAGGVAACGWLIAAAVPLALLRGDAGPRNTLQSLGLASSLGMTVAAVGLLVAVHRAWGPQVGQGLVRSAVVAVGSGALSAAVGRAIAGNLHPLGLATAATVTVMVAIAVLTLYAVSIWIGDRESARLVAGKLRRRAR